MNKSKEGVISNHLSASTPMSNWLIDEVMPTLGDTQWRVLCVIARQTIGWRSPSPANVSSLGRKEWDWLSHSQLKARTNRASAAVSAAIKKLVSRGLIEVRDDRGQIMKSAGDRRAARTKLYFRLIPRIEVEIDSSFTDTLASKRPHHIHSFSKIEFRNPKITKVMNTKALSISQSEVVLASVPSMINNISVANDELKVASLGFRSLFDEMYRKKMGCEAPLISESEVALLERQLSRCSPEELARRLPIFFASDLTFVLSHKHSLQSYLDTLYLLEPGKSL